MQLSEPDSGLLWKASQTFHSQFHPYRTEADTLAKTIGDTKRLDTERMDAQQRRIGVVVANIDALAQSSYVKRPRIFRLRARPSFTSTSST
jgi:hypothetical protein